MVHYNEQTRELAVKIVYYGPACSGKTENLRCIHQKVAPSLREPLLTLETETDRTLFFDFLPVKIGTFRDVRVRLLLYTVPGQVFYNDARKLVLEATDALVFVVDSSRSRLQENVDCFFNLEENLRRAGLKPGDIPLVIQYNQRDARDAVPVAELNRQLQVRSEPWFEAVATNGRGVIETFREAVRLAMIVVARRNGHFFASEAMAELTRSGLPTSILQ